MSTVAIGFSARRRLNRWATQLQGAVERAQLETEEMRRSLGLAPLGGSRQRMGGGKRLECAVGKPLPVALELRYARPALISAPRWARIDFILAADREEIHDC